MYTMNAVGELGKIDSEESKNNHQENFYFEMCMYMYKHLHLFYNSQILLYIPL